MGARFAFFAAYALVNLDVRVQVFKMQIAKLFMHLPAAFETNSNLASLSLPDLSTESSLRRRIGGHYHKFQTKTDLAP